MRFGARLRELWRSRRWVAVCAIFALFAAVWSVAEISLAPPGVSLRKLRMATASTQIVVDTPRSTLVDMRQDTYGITALNNRALLLGNVLATPQVRADIARRAHVPFDALQIIPPLTPKQPRLLAESGVGNSTQDILRINDQYRLYVRANPTVPFLQIFAQTPDAESAANLANAAVGGLETYLAELARSTNTPKEQQVRLTQLGRARGKVINDGIEWQFALLAFSIAFGASCATVIWVNRVRRGWRMAVAAEQTGA